jgi:gliding motility-associated-like protein
LDNGPWQDSPIFTNVSSGNHSISARDKNGCGFTSIDTCLIGAPNFFTPNGDGINETWNLKGTFCLEYANIYIFDRYGKLLKEFDLNNAGWNGTFNGELLPTNDYWFVIRYREINSDTEKEHKGHFTLKR